MATPIPLNFMWADESVLLDDIQRGISEGMVKWATDFYNNKSVNKLFELDVNPSSPPTKRSASKYVLTKSGGVSPDLRTLDEIVPAEKREYARLDQLIKEREKEQVELKKRETLLTSLIGTIEKEQDQLSLQRESSTDPQEIARIKIDQARARQERASAIASKERVSQSFSSSLTVQLRLYDEQRAVWDKMKGKESEISGDRMFRLQMALRYALDGIGSESRINVIFCKAKVSSGKYQVLGEARNELTERIEVLPSQFLLWPYRYIVIDLSPGHRKTLAHEVVHLSGRGHPDARTIFKGFKKVPLLNISLPDLEVVPGGFFDGPENDIMNYKRTDPEAKDTTMNILDQVDLRNYLLRLAGKPWSLAGTP